MDTLETTTKTGERATAGEAVLGMTEKTCQLWEIKISEMEIRERARAGKAERMTARKAGREHGAENETEAQREMLAAGKTERKTRTGEVKKQRRPRKAKREVTAGKAMTLGGPGKTEKEMKAGEA